MTARTFRSVEIVLGKSLALEQRWPDLALSGEVTASAPLGLPGTRATRDHGGIP